MSNFREQMNSSREAEAAPAEHATPPAGALALASIGAADLPHKLDADVVSADDDSLLGEAPMESIRDEDDTRALAERRRKRRPFQHGMSSQRLAYAARPGYHRHWFNDTPGRVDQAEQAGYAHVTDGQGRSVRRAVGTRDGGGVLEAYLMEIPQEWYDEDMAAQQKMVKDKEAVISKGRPADSQGEDASKFYNGSQGRVTRFSTSTKA